MGLLPDTQNCGLSMHRECQGHFPRHCGLAIPTCITARASRMCRVACRDRWLVVCFEVGGGENIPGISGACITRNFEYLVTGPWYGKAYLDFCEGNPREIGALPTHRQIIRGTDAFQARSNCWTNAQVASDRRRIAVYVMSVMASWYSMMSQSKNYGLHLCYISLFCHHFK